MRLVSASTSSPSQSDHCEDGDDGEREMNDSNGDDGENDDDSIDGNRLVGRDV